MGNNWPTSFNNLTGSETLASWQHAQEHNALETKIGINGSSDTSSHIYKLSSITGTDKAASFTKLENLGLFNVKDYGATGDGVTDDTTSLQSALNAANSAGGGIVFMPPGTYIHTSSLNIYKKTILQGSSIRNTVLKSNHTGDGIKSTWPINSSTAVNISLRDFKMWNTNVSNIGGAFDDVGGTFLDIRNCEFQGFAYGVIFDQTELSSIDSSLFSSNLIGGLWLVNNGDHSPGASADFTNRIDVSHCQFNLDSPNVGIVDDGGYSHNFSYNNFNGCGTHIRIAGMKNCTVIGSEFESATSASIKIEGTTYIAGTSSTGTIATIINNTIVPTAGQACIALTTASSLTLIGNFFGSTTSAKVTGVINVYSIFAMGNVNPGAGATFDGTSTEFVSSDTSGASLFTMKSLDKGFTPPRMSTTDRDAITSPIEGMVIYNTTTKVLNFYNGTSWGAV